MRQGKKVGYAVTGLFVGLTASFPVSWKEAAFMSEAPCSVAPAAPDAAAVPLGSAAPDFTLHRSGASPRSLKDLRGQTVVLAFAPPDWDPVRAEQRSQYNRVLTQIPGVRAELIDLSIQDQSCRLTLDGESVQMPFVSALDSQSDVAHAYGVSGRQALFVLDEQGIVRWRYVAPVGSAPRPDDLRDALQMLTEANAPGKKASGLALTRRQFVAAAMATAFALALPSLTPARAADAGPAEPVPTAPKPVEPGAMAVTLTVNGADHQLLIDPRVTLLDALRERIGLTGSKKGCDHGQCGACTVHADGKRINACLALAVSYQGKKITTIEGLAQGDTLHPVQAAFIAHDGFQCGYCTPGQIMSGAAMLTEPWGPGDADVREAMSGNICRCGAYTNIVAAIQDVRAGGKIDASV